MRKLLLLLIGLILLTLLLFFCFNSKVEGIKKELVSDAQTAYKNKNMNWADVEIKGDKFASTRVLVLNGTAPSEELKTKAGLIAANISGVEGVDNNLVVQKASPQVVEHTVESEILEVKEAEKKPKIEVVEVKIPEKSLESSSALLEQNAQNCNKKFVAIMSKYSINFEYNSASIKKSSYSLLDSIVDVTKECPKAQLSVEGHTDWDGSKKYNKILSSKRANAVKIYLISKGISSDRLESIGYGESKPIADNKTFEGKNKNRRIEFKIKGVK